MEILFLLYLNIMTGIVAASAVFRLLVAAATTGFLWGMPGASFAAGRWVIWKFVAGGRFEKKSGTLQGVSAEMQIDNHAHGAGEQLKS